MPNSSTSSRGSGIDAQLIDTNGALRVQTGVVNAPRNELFAGARLAVQQQRAKRSRCDSTRHMQSVAHSRALGDDGGELVAALA